MNELKIKLIEIMNLLKNRENKSYAFFEKIIRLIDEGNDKEYFELILGATPIIQYGDFNYKEENLFREIWKIANEINNSKN